MVQTGLSWQWIGATGKILQTLIEIGMQGISWLAEDIKALQEAYCSVDFVVRLVCVTSLNITDCQGHVEIQPWSGTVFEW